MMEAIGTILGILLYIAMVIGCILIFGILLGGALFVGSVGGFFIGIYRGLANYFSALVHNLKLRR